MVAAQIADDGEESDGGKDGKKKVLKAAKKAIDYELAQTTGQMEPQGGSINMQDADFNMYFYFEG